MYNSNNQNTQTKQKIASSEPLEKYFFVYILENPKFFERVLPTYFKNSKISLIYNCIQSNYINTGKKTVASNQKVRTLIRMVDPSADVVSDDYLRELLSVDLGEIIQSRSDDYLKRAFYAWMTSNVMKEKMYQAVDIVRNLSEIDFDDTVVVAEQLRSIINDATLTKYDDEAIGLRFTNAEDHIQNNEHNKISTGWATLDEMINGGISRKTLNLVMGGSNSGKSMWLCQFAAQMSETQNVLYITLEMSDKEVMKRIAVNKLRIPVQDYDRLSKDTDYITKQLKSYNTSANFNSNDLFSVKKGEIFIKEFASGACSIADIENHIKTIEETTGQKIDVLIVDYLTIMQPENNKNGSLFTNGKFLSNGLRAIGQNHDIAVITAMQVGKEAQAVNDLSMSDMSESKAIYENADMILGIIRTDAMRAESVYHLKLLKLRAGAFKFERTHFDFNQTYLRCENDKKVI
jgi:replicative DNA helicase